MDRMALLANVMAPYVGWGIGEDTQLSLPYSMMATLLAALVERPFLTMAGFRRLALIYSIRANILSWAGGVGIVFLFGTSTPGVFVLMLYLAVPFSLAIEGAFLWQIQQKSRARFDLAPFIAGNIISGVLLLVVQAAGYEIGDRMQLRHGRLIVYLTDIRPALCNAVLILCVFLFSLFLLVPDRLFRWSSLPKAKPVANQDDNPVD